MNTIEFIRANALVDACEAGRDAAPASLMGHCKNPYPKEQAALREAWMDGYLAVVKELLEAQ